MGMLFNRTTNPVFKEPNPDQVSWAAANSNPGASCFPNSSPWPWDDPPITDPAPTYISKITAEKDVALIKDDIVKLSVLLEEMVDKMTEQNERCVSDAVYFLNEAVDFLNKMTDE